MVSFVLFRHGVCSVELAACMFLESIFSIFHSHHCSSWNTFHRLSHSGTSQVVIPAFLWDVLIMIWKKISVLSSCSVSLGGASALCGLSPFLPAVTLCVVCSTQRSAFHSLVSRYSWSISSSILLYNGPASIVNRVHPWELSFNSSSQFLLRYHTWQSLVA